MGDPLSPAIPTTGDDTGVPVGPGLPVPPARPAPSRLPPRGQSNLIEQIFSGLGAPVALAYGRHVVGGHRFYQQEDSAQGVIGQALGEGEWDAIEWLEVNGARVDHTATATVHFHPGLDGEIGAETSPATRNQMFCSLLPAGFSPALHFPRTAYLVLKLPYDAEAPDDGFSLRASYKCLRVRQFDNTGTQTAYSYSANPAWCALDLILRAWLKPRAGINEALTTAEKALFDWPAWKDWADACAAAVGGEARWESHLPFVQQTDLRAGLEWILQLGRAYLVEKNGKLAPYHDQSRASLATYGVSDFLPGSLNLARRSMRNRPNRITGRYRNLDSGKGPGTISSSGVAVTGAGTDFDRRFQPAKMVRLLDGSQAGEVRSVADVTDLDDMNLDAAFSANQSGTAYESPNDAYQAQTRRLDDEDHQDRVGRVIEQALDLGNSTPSRAERLLAYTRARAGLSKLLSGHLVDQAASVRDLLPGDLVTLPAGQDFAGSQVTELLEVTIESDFSVTIAGIEYDVSIFIDTAGDQEPLSPVLRGDSRLTRVTQDQKTGAQLARDNIADTGKYNAVRYHQSAYRNKVDVTRSGSTTDNSTSWIDLASWVVTKPEGATRYGGGPNSRLTVSFTPNDATTWAVKGRLLIGAIPSNEVSIVNPTATATQTVLVSGLSLAELDIGVKLQVSISHDGLNPNTADADFPQTRYEDQDEGNFS